MHKKLRRVLCALLALTCLCGPHAYAAAAEAALELHVINVGKADCLLLKCDGLYMLIDTGLASDEARIAQYLAGQGVDRLEYLVATHPDKDHIGGVPWILERLSVGQVWECPLPDDGKAYLRMEAALQASGVEVIEPLRGYSATLGGARIDVLSPTEWLLATEDENECSIVLRVEYAGARLLLMGDAQAQAEALLLNSGLDLSADVLKVGHHGSDQSTGAAFLAAVNPRWALISCGYSDEDYYPANSTLARLSAAGCDVLRTDADGDITVRVIPGEGGAYELTAEASGADAGAAGYVLDTKRNVFHLATCTELPKKKNRLFCATREAAIAAGGTPCEICQP